MTDIVFLPIALSFLGFALTLLKLADRQKKALSILVSFFYCLFGIWSLMSGVLGQSLILQVGGWASPFGISLVYDQLSALLITVTGVVYFAVNLYSSPGKNAESSPLYFPLIHILICGISGAFITGDLFNLYVWFEVILLSSFVLLTLGQEKSRLAGAFKYVSLNILSSLIFLAAAGFIYNAAHTLNFYQLAHNLSELAQTDRAYVDTLNALIFVAFAIKSALFPFFFWLPASYHNMSPAISGLFAGLLTKVGLYAIFKVNLVTFPKSEYIQILLGVLAGLSILIGVAGAIIQTHIRRILGFHIISQVGYIALAGVFVLSDDAKLRFFGLAAAFFYMVHHILVKANLYLVSGLVRSVTGYERLSRMSGLVSSHPLIAFLFAIPALSLAGIPPLSGFWAKLGLFQVSLSAGYLLAIAVMILGGFFTVYSMAKIWLAAFWGEVRIESTGKAPLTALLACLLLGSLTVAIGLSPDLLFSQAESAARSLLEGGVHVAR